MRNFLRRVFPDLWELSRGYSQEIRKGLSWGMVWVDPFPCFLSMFSLPSELSFPSSSEVNGVFEPHLIREFFEDPFSLEALVRDIEEEVSFVSLFEGDSKFFVGFFIPQIQGFVVPGCTVVPEVKVSVWRGEIKIPCSRSLRNKIIVGSKKVGVLKPLFESREQKKRFLLDLPMVYIIHSGEEMGTTLRGALNPRSLLNKGIQGRDVKRYVKDAGDLLSALIRSEILIPKVRSEDEIIVRGESTSKIKEISGKGRIKVNYDELHKNTLLIHLFFRTFRNLVSYVVYFGEREVGRAKRLLHYEVWWEPVFEVEYLQNRLFLVPVRYYEEIRIPCPLLLKLRKEGIIITPLKKKK